MLVISGERVRRALSSAVANMRACLGSIPAFSSSSRYRSASMVWWLSAGFAPGDEISRHARFSCVV